MQTRRNEGMRARQGRVSVIVLGGLTGLAIAGVAVAVVAQQQERAIRLAAERQLALVKADNEQLQRQIDEARAATLALETELTRAQAEAEEVAGQLTQEREAKETLAKSVDDRQREVDRL